MHKIRWTLQKIERRLRLIEPLVYRHRWPLPPFRYQELASAATIPPLAPDFDDSQWPIIQPNHHWSAWQKNFILRTWVEIPAGINPTLPLALYLPLSPSEDFSHPEALVYLNGQGYAATDRHHQEILLPAGPTATPFHLALHGWTGRDLKTPAQPWLGQCELVQIDQPTRDFIAQVRVAWGIASNLGENEPARAHLLNGLDAAFKQLETASIDHDLDTFYQSVSTAQEILAAGIAAAGPPLPVNVVAAGHAHIDLAWLWTLDQTRQKAGRTFHTVLRLMEQFPTYHFSQSQPQLYDFVRQDYPALFAAIQQRVVDGRWEALGGMWVEADCNLSGSESLARQFLLGRDFFRQQLGQDSPVLWLPDVFGYAWNLPQLIKLAGLEYFFTIKISWNQYNRMPYDSFWWQGLDGTRVLTHYSPTAEKGSGYMSTYNAKASPDQLLTTWRNFQQKELSQTLLMAYGYGDGGGGPTREMLENIGVMAQFPATPQVRPGRVIDFFRQLERESAEQLPVWNGELYLEYHRGTYTSQSRNKRANRKAEFALHDAEFLLAYAQTMGCAISYSLRQAWELLCLNQFHDIIPGSSIGDVYVESLAHYEKIMSQANEASQTALTAIAGRIQAPWLMVNPTSFTRPGLLFCPQLPANLPAEQTQAVEGGYLLNPLPLPPYAVQPLAIAQTPPGRLFISPTELENDFLRLELNPAGDIIRLFDKQNQREVLPAGAITNQFQAFEDRPLNWDAWDIDIFYDDRTWLADPAGEIRVLEAGPLRATLEIRRQILHSPFSQRLSLSHNSPCLEIHTTIDWRERHTLLKVAFPVDVLAPVATYEIQWGNVQRPTHRNTSWDWARFESCAQKWVDLSEGDYGLSLLNDCKYGHDIRDQVIRLSLLRSPTWPDPQADQGSHHFAYALLPHAGPWGSDTIAQAYALNDPLLVYQAPAGTNQPPLAWDSLIQVNRPNVVIETVKPAENGQGIIVRLYEAQRQRGKVTLSTPFPLLAVWQTNLLEENEVELPCSSREVTLAIKPYQIITLRLVPTAD